MMIKPFMHLAAALGLLSFAAIPAFAAGPTDVNDGFPRDSDEDGVDFTVGATYDFQRRTDLIRREFRCLAHDTIPGGGAELCPDGSAVIDIDEMRVERITHILDLELNLALWRYAEFSIHVPIVLSDATDLRFADGVDPQNSTVDPYNQPSLFGLPRAGTERSGAGDPSIGVRVTPLSNARDRTRPTWSIDAQLTIPTTAFGADVRRANNTAISQGLWLLDVGTGVSFKPERWVDPWARVGARLRFSDTDSLFQNHGSTQTLEDPGHSFQVAVGAEFIPWETDEDEQFVIELGARFEYQMEGRDYTDLFDALGSSPCDPRDPVTRCDLTTFTRGDTDPDTGDRLKSNGITDIEQFARFEGWLGLSVQPIRYFEIGARFSVSHETGHFLTFADAGRDLDGDRLIEEDNGTGVNELSPVYNENYDALGTRFRSAGATTLGFQLHMTAKF